MVSLRFTKSEIPSLIAISLRNLVANPGFAQTVI